VTAIRLQPGDRVRVRGQWRRITAIRHDRYASGCPVMILKFEEVPALRVNAGARVAVQEES
jgi:hypothetical protein